MWLHFHQCLFLCLEQFTWLSMNTLCMCMYLLNLKYPIVDLCLVYWEIENNLDYIYIFVKPNSYIKNYKRCREKQVAWWSLNFYHPEDLWKKTWYVEKMYLSIIMNDQNDDFILRNWKLLSLDQEVVENQQLQSGLFYILFQWRRKQIKISLFEDAFWKIYQWLLPSSGGHISEISYNWWSKSKLA